MGLFMGLVLSLPAAIAQQTATVYDPTKYILVDARTLRGQLGYAAFGISDVDTLPDRLGQGVNMRIEGRIVSSLVKRTKGFVVADAFFLDMTLGTLTSAPLFYYTNPEDRFSGAVTFGYSFLAGYSTDRFGILGGKSFNWSTVFVGGTELPGAELMVGHAPWTMRLEFRPAFSNEFRIMLTGWDNFNDLKRSNGFRVDVPFLPKKRFFLTYELSRLGSNVSYASFDNGQYATGLFTQHLFGLRFGSIY